MKLSELIEKYGDEEMEEKEFKALFDIKEPKAWLPRNGEAFRWVNDFGCVSVAIYSYKSEADLVVRNNPVFKTEAEGEFHAEKNRFLLQMERDFIENSEPIDWGNKVQDKWYLYFDWEDNGIRVSYRIHFQGKEPYTTDKEWLERYIKENEADIRRYYFDIN